MGWRSRLLDGTLPPRIAVPVRSRIGFSREFELKAISKFVAPGDHVLDIGAHLGNYTYRFAKAVGAAGRVLCFEPQPELAEYLVRAFRSPRYENVEVLNVGLSDQAGRAWLSVPQDGEHPDRGRASLEDKLSQAGFEVNTCRLDDLALGDSIAFIKCDVEGHELAVLQGASSTLHRYRPTLLVEIEHQHVGDGVVETFSLLDRLDYEPHYLDSDCTLRQFPLSKLERPEKLNYIKGERYINNFIFINRRR